MAQIFDELFEQFDFGPCCEESFRSALDYVLGTDDQEHTFDNEQELGRTVMRQVAHERVGPAIAQTILLGSNHSSPMLDHFLDRLDRAELESAATHYLRALNLERDGLLSEAENELELAIKLNPHYKPALSELAWYVTDHGDLRRANGLYRRAGVEIDDLRRVYLEDLLHQVVAGVGRNDLCPCGSGRKYKTCCLRKATTPIERRVGLLYQKLIASALRPQNRDLFGPIFEAAGDCTGDAVSDQALPLLMELIVFGPQMWDRFVDTRWKLLPADEQQTIQTWAGTRPTLWQVTELEVGATITLLDPLSGISRLVTERSGSRQLKVDDYLYALIVPVGSGFQIIGVPILLSMAHRNSLLQVLERGGDFRELAQWTASLYGPIGVRTSDGQELVICRVVLVPRTTSWEEITVALDEQFCRERNQHWTVYGDGDASNVVHGWLERENDHLAVSTNAVEREERILATLFDSIEDLEVLEAERRDWATAQKSSVSKSSALPEPGVFQPKDDMPDEVQEALRNLMREREDAWVDESIPALHGFTPRQAAGDPTRREELIALLNEFDRRSMPDFASYDVDRLRRLLGVQPNG